MIYQALASGSNGNCSVISTDAGAILIDAGISRKRILNGLKELKIDPSDVTGVLITHAHSDHVSGLPVLMDTLDAPVIATPETISEIARLKRRDRRYEKIAEQAYPLEIGSEADITPFGITPYRTIHDIDGASGFSINVNDVIISYATDTGVILPEFEQRMKESHVVIIESNHDKRMLIQSRRPAYLKKRIRETHLSNDETMKHLQNIVSAETEVIFFAHLSGECNTPRHVMRNIETLWKNIDHDCKWSICTRWSPGSILDLKGKFRLIGGLSMIHQPSEIIDYGKNKLSQYF